MNTYILPVDVDILFNPHVSVHIIIDYRARRPFPVLLLRVSGTGVVIAMPALAFVVAVFVMAAGVLLVHSTVTSWSNMNLQSELPYWEAGRGGYAVAHLAHRCLRNFCRRGCFQVSSMTLFSANLVILHGSL